MSCEYVNTYWSDQLTWYDTLAIHSPASGGVTTAAGAGSTGNVGKEKEASRKVRGQLKIMSDVVSVGNFIVSFSCSGQGRVIAVRGRV